jgi:hypothetical protein
VPLAVLSVMTIEDLSGLAHEVAEKIDPVLIYSGELSRGLLLERYMRAMAELGPGPHPYRQGITQCRISSQGAHPSANRREAGHPLRIQRPTQKYDRPVSETDEKIIGSQSVGNFRLE